MLYVIRERQEILIWAAGLSDEELELQTNLATFNTLYSAAEEMAERGFSEKIIRERIKYEKHLREEEKILQILCESRGIETLKGYRKDEYEYSDTIINSLEEKYKGVDLLDMCDKLSKSKETLHLVNWFGDYALWEPAVNVKKDDILIAYDKVMTSEQQKTSQQNRATHRSR